MNVHESRRAGCAPVPGRGLVATAMTAALALALAPCGPAVAADDDGNDEAAPTTAPTTLAIKMKRAPSEVKPDDQEILDEVEEGLPAGQVAAGSSTLAIKLKSAPVRTVAFDAGRGTFRGGAGGADAQVVTREVVGAAPVEAPAAPVRTGWDFKGWHVASGAPDAEWDEDGPSIVPLGAAWDFADNVGAGALTLYARWELRLDVTVPVAVGFAVNADDRTVTTPDAGKYAIKSRTVRPVSVESVGAVSRPEEKGGLAGFFGLADGSGVPASAADRWADPLGATRVIAWSTRDVPVLGAPDWSVEPAPGAEDAKRMVAVPLADGAESYQTMVDPADDTSYQAWVTSVPAPAEAFTLSGYTYPARPAWDPVVADAWDGSGDSVTLPIKFGMQISPQLTVRTDLDGAKPITRLVLTISAKV